MSREGRHGRRGWGWFILLAIPPLLVTVGLAAFLIWQGSRGGITPKWKKPATSTNAVVEAPNR